MIAKFLICNSVLFIADGNNSLVARWVFVYAVLIYSLFQWEITNSVQYHMDCDVNT